MDKSTEIFEYACEGEKKTFQACISSLLELQSLINQKRLSALQDRKNGAWITVGELKVIEDWILELSGKAMGSYSVLDRTNRNAFRMHRCTVKIREKQTPDLKKLLS